MLCMLLYMTLCAGLESTESCGAFFFCVLTFFFLIQSQHLTKSSMNSAFVHCSWTHKFHFSTTFFIKNRSRDTIHTFKNYFASVFSFSNNKLNPNGPCRFHRSKQGLPQRQLPVASYQPVSRFYCGSQVT